MSSLRLALAALSIAALSLPVARDALAQGALKNETLLEYIRSRDDLAPADRARWETEIKVRFGGAALDEDSKSNVQITVAKSIISNAIFMEIDPKKAVGAAFEGYRGTLGYVPPPIAINYQLLALEGKKPKGTMEQLTFDFPKYYDDEIAPDVAAYWEQALKDGTIPDYLVDETKDALAKTQVKMRPLLADKLRVLARLDLERSAARGARRTSIERDMKEIEDELTRSFSGVAKHAEVLNRGRPPFERLKTHLKDLGRALSEDDRALEPSAPAPIEEPPPPPPPPGKPKPPKPPVTHRPSADGLIKYAGPVAAQLTTTIEPWLGTPYLWGGTQKKTGTDCSGFTKGVAYEGFIFELPRVSQDQARTGVEIDQNDLKPGDLIFFDTKDVGHINHVGIYAGAGKFAHASSSKGVIYAELAKKYYQKAYRKARRFLAP